MFQATNPNPLCKDEITQIPKGWLERDVYNPCDKGTTEIHKQTAKFLGWLLRDRLLLVDHKPKVKFPHFKELFYEVGWENENGVNKNTDVNCQNSFLHKPCFYDSNP